MTRTLLATTAIAALLTTGAFTLEAMAQTTTTQPPASDSTTTGAAGGNTAAEPANPPGMKSADEVKAKEEAVTDGHIASTLMGASVYNSAGKDGQDIGNVDDLVIDKDGKIVSVVVGVGGFLGIGSKDVAIDYSQVKWEQGNGNWWIIVPTTTDQLKALPDFDPKPYQAEPAESNATGGAGTGATAPSTGMGTSGMTTAPATGGAEDNGAATDTGQKPANQ
jgi:sporulation protein YlmC with PRC-barrel domain